MTVTKAHIIQKLFAQNIFTKGESAQIIEMFFERIKQSLENGEDMMDSGFGKFQVLMKNQRCGRNPQTGDSLMLEPRVVVTYKCSGILRETMNGGAGS